ncbi:MULTISPECIES: potassium channel family protein [Chitinophaga]|uniref:potassium channel family protein n=1 Tax=Chitinophaga TaxID=79328 RepID=UPI00301037EC
MIVKQFLQQYKYEVLLIALMQHLFIGIFLKDLPFYTEVIWPINMLILGLASVGVFIGKGEWKNVTRNALFLLVLALPIGLRFWGRYPGYFLFLNVAYVVFFIFIFWQIVGFLIRPGYINADIISASACGYLLLIEISTFLLQYFLYQNPASFKGIDMSNPAATYVDLVYFSSITLTSIGFGDITPSAHYTKLITSVFGIAGQFYTVVLVGIIISKFSSKNSTDEHSKPL